MTEQQRDLFGILSLATAGFLSGLASPNVLLPRDWHFAIFPIAIAIALWLCCQIRSAKLIMLVVAGLISAPAGFWVGFAAAIVAEGLFSKGWDSPQFLKPLFLVGGTVAGFVGAAVLIGAFYLLFYPQSSFWRWLKKTVLWSSGAGALAMAGLIMETNPNRSMKLAVVMWQTGMGVLFGALIRWERQRQRIALGLPDTPRRGRATP